MTPTSIRGLRLYPKPGQSLRSWSFGRTTGQAWRPCRPARRLYHCHIPRSPADLEDTCNEVKPHERSLHIPAAPSQAARYGCDTSCVIKTRTPWLQCLHMQRQTTASLSAKDLWALRLHWRIISDGTPRHVTEILHGGMNDCRIHESLLCSFYSAMQIALKACAAPHFFKTCANLTCFEGTPAVQKWHIILWSLGNLLPHWRRW